MSYFPSQKLSLAEKLKRDSTTKKTWGENCVDYLIQNSNWQVDREEIYRLKRLVEGEYDDQDLNYILNPLNTTVEKYKRFGARLRNFNILAPVRDLYLGEFGKRFKSVQVMESNPDDDNLYKTGLNQTVRNYYTQSAINELNALGLDTGQESVDQPPLKNVISEYDRNFDENRVITGQETLDFLKFDKELDDVYQDIYQDWIEVGRAFSYKGIFQDDIDFEHVPAEQLVFPKNQKGNFLEDSAWVVRRQILQPHQILDRHGDAMDKAAKEYLHQKITKDNLSLASDARFVVLPTQWISSTKHLDSTNVAVDKWNGIELFHVCWRSWRKVGILTYMSEIGVVSEMEVDESYKLDTENGDISIKWDWISQVWEGYRLEDSEHYFHIRPLPYNRAALNNSGKQKLPYNGRFMTTVTGGIKSIIKTGEAYQALYDIAHYQFEKTLNKNKDKITVMPMGLIPKGREGWDEEKFMYYAYANSLMIIDEASPTAGLALQGIKTLDVGLQGYIKEMYEIMNAIKAEWWEAIGMNRQRYGDTQASDGKGVTEQAIFRSAIISEELNRKFEKFQERDYEGLLDLSKLAYLNGKKGKYVNSEQREAFLIINPDDAVRRLGSDFGIHVRNSATEDEKLKMLQQYAFSYAQNDGDPSIMMEMLDTTNFTKGKYTINKMIQANRRLEQAENERVREHEQSLKQQDEASKEADREVERYKADREYDRAIDVKMLDVEAKDNNEKDADGKAEERAEKKRMNDHTIEMDKEGLNLDKRDQKRKEKETNAKVRQNGQAAKVN